MACNSITLQSIDARCENSVGGIKRILLANRDDVTATIATTSNPNELITSITKASGKKFAEWKFRPNTGSYTSTATVDNTIGNSSVSTTVTLQFSKAEATKRVAISAALQAGAVVLIEDMYGQVLYLGLDNEVYVTSATMVSGTQNSDLSGFTVEFTYTSFGLPNFVDTAKVNINSLLV